MNKIRQHRPAFFEGFENETVEFNTVDELLSIPFVKNFASIAGFHRYSLSSPHLMAEYRGGREWWVVGFIEKPEKVDLPKWKAIYQLVEEDGSLKDFAHEEVSWSTGRDVRLKDGRTLKQYEPK